MRSEKEQQEMKPSILSQSMAEPGIPSTDGKEYEAQQSPLGLIFTYLFSVQPISFPQYLPESAQWHPSTATILLFDLDLMNKNVIMIINQLFL